MFLLTWRQLLQLALIIIIVSATAAAEESSKSPAPGPDAEAFAYRIGPGDVLQVDVWKEPDVSTPSATVRPDGRISLPMLGELRVAGLTPAEVQQSVSEKFGKLIRGAQVTVMLREIHSQKIYLIGEVRREGPIRLVGPLTVLQALAEAGGMTDYAKRRRIYILRMAGERHVRIPFDYDAVVRGAKIEQNIVLLPGDTIIVPR